MLRETEGHEKDDKKTNREWKEVKGDRKTTDEKLKRE